MKREGEEGGGRERKGENKGKGGKGGLKEERGSYF